MRSRAGFTLLEVSVVGAISSVLAGALLTIFYLTNTQMHDGTSNQRLEQLASAFSDQVHRIARRTHHSKLSGEASCASASLTGTSTVTGLTRIDLCDDANVQMGGYQVLTPSNIVQEYRKSLGIWIPFTIGRDTLKAVYSESDFTTLSKRRGMTFRLSYYLVDGSTTYKLPPVREAVQFRNQTR